MKKDFIKLLEKPNYIQSVKMLDEGVKIVPIVSEDNELLEIIDVKKISAIPIHDPRLVGNELKYLTELPTPSNLVIFLA